jgi:glycosyltransferase involved in cell wall biosynthesis
MAVNCQWLTISMSNLNPRSSWLLVSAGVHEAGGMERANLELARYLVAQGTEVHLVTHHVDRELLANRLVQVHSIPKPVSSFMLGEPFLSRKGAATAGRLTLERPGTRVLANGGCCGWPDINWVHYVHAAWRTHDDGAPLWFKAKNRAMKLSAQRQEQHALRQARFIVANSNKTKCDLTNLLGLSDANIRTVYLGVDAESKYFGLKERLRGRAMLGRPVERPIVAFVGAMGHDNRKGFDTLYAAWKQLSAMPNWDADLVVAGGGRAIPRWQKCIAEAGLAHRVTLLGFTDRMNDLFAASDLLVSPVRYEAFGLNVQEALAGGIPAIVSAAAGVAELYPSYLKDLLLPNPEDVDDLVAKLISWRASMSYWKERVIPLSRELRAYTWEEMARRIVEFAGESAASGARVNENSTTRATASLRQDARI